MSLPIDEARKSGYSDDEIFDFLQKKDPNLTKKFQNAQSEGYSSKEILDFLREKDLPSKTRSKVSAPLKGALKEIQDLTVGFAPGPVPQKLGTRLLEQFLPTRPEDEFLVRAGRLAPIVALGPESLPLKGAQLTAGTLGGELAKEEGLGELGQSLAEAGGMSLPALAKSGFQAAKQFIKTPKETFTSGLQKPRSVEAKFPKGGTLSKERQEKVIQNLDKEAADLIKSSVEKHQPTVKKIEEGFDFESQFEKDFGKVQKLAEKANPEIDITPLSKFVQETSKKYKGIPKLHPEAKKITEEIRAFANRAPISLKNLLKTFRSNHQKIKNIYETSRLTGKQQEYVDFLSSYNRAITDSIKEALPTDSAWVKLFDQSNKDFRNYKQAQKTLAQFREVYGETPTLQKVEKLANDVKKQKQLALSIGKEGSEEIIQIAKDLKQAKDSIKNIPKTEISKFDATFPIYYLIPYIGKLIGLGSTALKAIKFGRYGYGWLLSTSAKRKAYRNALNALINQDLESYKKATLILNQELTKS